MTLQLQSTEQASKTAGEATPEGTENLSSDTLITVIGGLRNQLEEANQQASTAFGAGYQQALDSNPRTAVDDQIQEALKNERIQAQITLRNAEARKEEALWNELDRQWKLPRCTITESINFPSEWWAWISSAYILDTPCMARKIPSILRSWCASRRRSNRPQARKRRWL